MRNIPICCDGTGNEISETAPTSSNSTAARARRRIHSRRRSCAGRRCPHGSSSGLIVSARSSSLAPAAAAPACAAAAATSAATAAAPTHPTATATTASAATTATPANDNVGQFHFVARGFLIEEIERGETDVGHFLFAKDEALIGRDAVRLRDITSGHRGCGCAPRQ